MQPTPRRPSLRLLAASAALLGLAGTSAAAAVGAGPLPADAARGYAQAHGLRPDTSARAVPEVPVRGATPRARCGPGSMPETGRQGRVPQADFVSGRAAKGYTCNARSIGHHGRTGGFQVHRYTDRTGRTCAYYDSTLLFPKDLRKGVLGTTVLDMSDPTRPVQTAVLATPAMQSTHESLRVNHRRGLLAAGMGSPSTQVGVVDVYDISGDCRHPVLQSSTPLGVLGHESGFSPDGRTFWVTTTSRPGITAIDVSDPRLPRIVWRSTAHQVHGLSFNADGTRAYLADTALPGMTVLDVSQVQRRVPSPVVRTVSSLTWPEVSIPQNTIPVTIEGERYVIEFDEYDSVLFPYSEDAEVGAARIVDISDERRPRVVSRIRLEVHEKAARASDQKNDPQAQFPVQGYSAHYCSVPRQVEPGILACSMILSGLRVFDVRDPLRPKEIAYFNRPNTDAEVPLERGGFAMSAPAFDPATRSVWYSDGNTGFFNVQLTNGVWRPSGRYPAPQG